MRAPEHLARRLQQVCDSLFAGLFAEHGMANWQYALVVQVRATPGLDAARLAAAVGRDATSTGQALDMLVARGLVARCVAPHDRRARAFTLTPAGLAFHEAMRPRVTAISHQITAPLSLAERETLLDLLARIVVANEEHARPGAGRRRPSRRGPVAAATEEAQPCTAPASLPRAAARSASSVPSSAARKPRRRPRSPPSPA
nr:MarR family winged helix-turn-helix transcriptional regulator [Plastoroseomonas hellenica]